MNIDRPCSLPWEDRIRVKSSEWSCPKPKGKDLVLPLHLLLPNSRSWKKKKRPKRRKKQTPANTMLNAAYMSCHKKKKTQKGRERRKAKFNSRQRIAGQGDQASQVWSSGSKSWSCFLNCQSNVPRLPETLVAAGVIDFVLVILALVVRALPWAS
jgi:hypothetical protein